MPQLEKGKGELEDALRRQLSNLRRSFVAFDEGAYEEGERIATSLYVLCHHGRSNRSLLRMLGLRSKASFPDTGTRNTKERYIVDSGPPLLAMWKSGGSISMRPKLDLSKIEKRLPFAKWWRQEVYTNLRGQSLSRMNLVFGLSSKDGGAHVDKKMLNDEYFAFSRKSDHVTWDGSKQFALRDGLDHSNDHLFTVRQIGWELEYALIDLGY